jgi:putative ABC transport system substrate-binding protein
LLFLEKDKNNMPKKIKILLFIAAILLIFSSCSRNQEPEKYTIGIINLSPSLDRVISEFKKGMSQYGYTEGSNITYIYNGPLKNPQQVDQEFANLLKADINLLLTQTTPVTKRVKQLTKDSNLPVLFAPVFSPAASGLVDSLAHPGENITGIKVRGSTGKALEWFLKTVPSAKRIFVPFHYTDKAAVQTVADLQEAASFFNVKLITQQIASEEDLNTVLAHIPADIDGIWITHSHLIMSNMQKIISAATLLKKPTISSTDQSTAGVMLCYAMSLDMIGRQASRMADKILHGASPATIPVESADYFLGLNLKTANAINIKIPDDIISQAEFVTR